MNYKIRITSLNRNQNVILESEQRLNMNREMKWYSYWERLGNRAIDFPLILSNMGGKDSRNELLNLTLYNDDVIIRFLITDEDLYDYIETWIDLFFATHNFGQRSTKGFGSFSVTRITDKAGEVEETNFPAYDLPEGTPFLKIDLSNKNDRQKQFCLFQTIDFYWKCLKSGVNFTRDGQYPNRYIKSFLWIYLDRNGKTWEKRSIKEKFDLTTGNERPENSNPKSFARAMLGCPDKFEYRNKGKVVEVSHNEIDIDEIIARIPSPIIFKPIFTDNVVRVYIIFDYSIQERLSIVGNKSFKFTCGSDTKTLDIDPDVIDYNALFKQYHVFLSETVAQKFFFNNDEYQSFVEDYELDGKRWFIPMDFNWDDILSDNKWVELYKTKSR